MWEDAFFSFSGLYANNHFQPLDLQKLAGVELFREVTEGRNWQPTDCRAENKLGLRKELVQRVDRKSFPESRLEGAGRSRQPPPPGWCHNLLSCLTIRKGLKPDLRLSQEDSKFKASLNSLGWSHLKVKNRNAKDCACGSVRRPWARSPGLQKAKQSNPNKEKSKQKTQKQFKEGGLHTFCGHLFVFHSIVENVYWSPKCCGRPSPKQY